MAHHESKLKSRQAVLCLATKNAYLLNVVPSKRIRLYCITKGFLLNRFDVQKKAKINEYNESLEVSVRKSRDFFCPGKEMT